MFKTFFGWFTGIFAGIQTYLIIGLSILAILGGIYAYYSHLQNKITTLTSDNAAYKSALNVDNQTITKLTADFQDAQIKLLTLNGNYNSIDAETNLVKLNFNFSTADLSNSKTLKIKINKSINQIFTNINIATQPSTFNVKK